MSEGKRKVPEFFIFDRLDELENITLELMEKADVEKPSVEGALRLAKHASTIAEYGFLLAFRGAVDKAGNKKVAKAMKDLLFKGIREGAVIERRVDVIESILSDMLADLWE